MESIHYIKDATDQPDFHAPASAPTVQLLADQVRPARDKTHTHNRRTPNCCSAFRALRAKMHHPCRRADRKGDSMIGFTNVLKLPAFVFFALLLSVAPSLAEEPILPPA